MAQTLYSTTKTVVKSLPDRTAEVVFRRFGIDNGKRETLESIGQSFDITRERVRQIEVSALKTLRNNALIANIQQHLMELEQYMHEHGSIMAENHVLDHFASLNNNESESQKAVQGCVLLLLHVGDNFYRMRGTDEFHPHWVADKTKIDNMKSAINLLENHFSNRYSTTTRRTNKYTSKNRYQSQSRHNQSICKCIASYS